MVELFEFFGLSFFFLTGFVNGTAWYINRQNKKQNKKCV